jgi:hypothetical protein
LWDAGLPVPNVSEILSLQNVKFHEIKKYEPMIDGFNWLHGVALVWHKGKLYCSFGLNEGLENTATEVAAGRVSADGGKTWSEIFFIDKGEEPELAVSHGVFLSRGEELWAFQGSFYGKRKNVHMRAYLLDEISGNWKKMGIVAGNGFWPMDKPVLMVNDNYILGGFSVGGLNQSAVAISDGDNLLNWEVVRISQEKKIGKMWGESTVIVDGQHVLNISRYGAKSIALISHSLDYGQTWTLQCESNLPMTTSKPYGGILSTGQYYLINSIASNIGKNRFPLSIALSKSGEKTFSEIFRIRDDIYPNGPGESVKGAALSYPYAIEHERKLYVAFSNNGGRGKNRNSAELAIIPISDFKLPRVDE